jgi:hypothetical protein
VRDRRRAELLEAPADERLELLGERRAAAVDELLQGQRGALGSRTSSAASSS